MAEIKKVDDAGAYIPYAHKHMVHDRPHFNLGAGLSLGAVWPEPDWGDRIKDGLPMEAAALLAMIYAGLPRSPRGKTRSVTEAEWAAAYLEGLSVLRELFDATRTMEQASSLNERYASHFGLDIKALPTDVRAALPLWAVGRGQRRFRLPAALTLRQAALAKWLPSLGWPESDKAIQLGVVPVEFVGGKWGVGRIVGDCYEILCQDLSSREMAIEVARGEIERISGLSVPARTAENLVRIGPSARSADSDVSPDDLIATFGFRGVQFGSTLGQAERQLWLNEIYDAFSDLADMLELPKKWIGLGGVGVAIGARGRGDASAHYEPTLKVFNFTRRSGMGCLAHEFAHALDHRLGTRWYAGAEKEIRFASEVHALRTGKGELANRLRPMLDGLEGYFRPPRSHAGGQGFYRQARAIEAVPRAKKHYWTTRREMFARAFESHVEDLLSDQGRCSPYLVFGTQNPGEQGENWPYPLGLERKAIRSLLVKMVFELRSPG